MGRLWILRRKWKCSSTWTVDNGWTCNSNVPNVCTRTWGNGVYNAGESWDDNNGVSGDGCSSTCQVESNYIWSTSYPSQCKLSWGDGVVSSNEKWDDGNNISGDGCSASWTVEDNYSCSGQPSVWKISIVASSTQSAVASTFQATLGVGNKNKVKLLYRLFVSNDSISIYKYLNVRNVGIRKYNPTNQLRFNVHITAKYEYQLKLSYTDYTSGV